MSQISSGLNSSVGASGGASGASSVGGGFNLKAEDFIKMMITQLQHQDPMEPAKNAELLAQMSQIGQLQSATTLQGSLESMTLQSNLSSAGNMIGKHVAGLDGDGAPIDGLVTSVRVEGNDVWLELDTGNTVRLDNVTAIHPTAGGLETA